MAFSCLSHPEVVAELLRGRDSARILIDDSCQPLPHVGREGAAAPDLKSAAAVIRVWPQPGAEERMGVVEIDDEAVIVGIVDHARIDVRKPAMPRVHRRVGAR